MRQTVRLADGGYPVIGMALRHLPPAPQSTLLAAAVPLDPSLVSGGPHVSQKLSRPLQKRSGLLQPVVRDQSFEQVHAGAPVLRMLLAELLVKRDPRRAVGEVPVDGKTILRHTKLAVILLVVRLQPQGLLGTLLRLRAVSVGHVIIEGCQKSLVFCFLRTGPRLFQQKRFHAAELGYVQHPLILQQIGNAFQPCVLREVKQLVDRHAKAGRQLRQKLNVRHGDIIFPLAHTLGRYPQPPGDLLLCGRFFQPQLPDFISQFHGVSSQPEIQFVATCLSYTMRTIFYSTGTENRLTNPARRAGGWLFSKDFLKFHWPGWIPPEKYCTVREKQEACDPSPSETIQAKYPMYRSIASMTAPAFSSGVPGYRP